MDRTDPRLTKDGQRLPKTGCLNCGKPLDAAGRPGPDGARPGPGDVTVCLGCGHIMIYADDMTMREPTAEEVVEIAGDPEILEAQRFVGEYQKVARKEGWT
jgi:hypothetical protein